MLQIVCRRYTRSLEVLQIVCRSHTRRFEVLQIVCRRHPRRLVVLQIVRRRCTRRLEVLQIPEAAVVLFLLLDWPIWGASRALLRTPPSSAQDPAKLGRFVLPGGFPGAQGILTGPFGIRVSKSWSLHGEPALGPRGLAWDRDPLWGNGSHVPTV